MYGPQLHGDARLWAGRGPGKPRPNKGYLLYHTTRTKAKQPVHALLAEQ